MNNFTLYFEILKMKYILHDTFLSFFTNIFTNIFVKNIFTNIFILCNFCI